MRFWAVILAVAVIDGGGGEEEGEDGDGGAVYHNQVGYSAVAGFQKSSVAKYAMLDKAFETTHFEQEHPVSTAPKNIICYLSVMNTLL